MPAAVRRSPRNRRAPAPSRSSFSENEGAFTTDDEPEPEEEEEAPKPKKVSKKSVITRTITAWAMILSYLLMLRAGHFYCILAGVCTQVELYRELVNVRYVPAKERKMPWFRSLQWGWFWVSMSWVYGEASHNFCMEHKAFRTFTPLTQHFDKVAFVMYCILFVSSVLSMRKDMVRFQISQYMWSLVTILLVVVQCKFFASYTLKGLFWFFFPMATVVMNDVSAYFCGITMGRKYIKAPFLSLSPNKTWEGFMGAGLLTVIFSFFFPVLLSRFRWLTCPAEVVTIMPFPPAMSACDINPIFLPSEYIIPVFGGIPVTLLPIQLHGLAYGLFASIIAPFGGFFASAIKRAYSMKDFDNFFPGHGGMMDRMDCQLFMMAFTSFHYQYFIMPLKPSVDAILAQVAHLGMEERALFLAEFKNMFP
jgi:phosphatidate cytidylyltransferase